MIVVGCVAAPLLICSEHGAFRITPDNHVQGKGCPSCSRGGYSNIKAGTFYILKVTEDTIKFGITNNFDNRLEQLKNKSDFSLATILRIDFDDGSIPRAIENRILKDSTIKRCVVNKADLRSGYTETTFYSNLYKILDIVEEIGGKESYT